jgi:hypothetical protein
VHRFLQGNVLIERARTAGPRRLFPKFHSERYNIS